MYERRNHKGKLNYFKQNENGNMHIKLWAIDNIVFRGNFIALNSYVKKEGTFKVNYLMFYLKKLEKMDKLKPK